MKSLKISNLINKAIDNFINLLNGEEFEDDRKQIQLKLERVLMPIINETNLYESKIQQKLSSRKQKFQEVYMKENLDDKKILNEHELKYNIKIQKCGEKYNQKVQQRINYIDFRLAEGQLAFQKIQQQTL